jgi:hypothetical protein
MSASLIGRLGSSTFRLSPATVAMSLTGSRFSSESAPRPFHHRIRGRGGTIYTAALPSNQRQVQADMRTRLIHRPARDIIPPLGVNHRWLGGKESLAAIALVKDSLSLGSDGPIEAGHALYALQIRCASNPLTERRRRGDGRRTAGRRGERSFRRPSFLAAPRGACPVLSVNRYRTRDGCGALLLRAAPFVHDARARGPARASAPREIHAAADGDLDRASRSSRRRRAHSPARRA